MRDAYDVLSIQPAFTRASRNVDRRPVGTVHRLVIGLRSTIKHEGPAMSQQSSLADCAIDAVSAVRAIGEQVDNDHPMRHAVRALKRTSEQILFDAFRQARDLSYQAERLLKDYEETKKRGAA